MIDIRVTAGPIAKTVYQSKPLEGTWPLASKTWDLPGTFGICQCPNIDTCGVCNGTGTTCNGCDGVFGSNKQYDVCGFCGGDGATCALPDPATVPNVTVGDNVLSGSDVNTCTAPKKNVSSPCALIH